MKKILLIILSCLLIAGCSIEREYNAFEEISYDVPSIFRLEYEYDGIKRYEYNSDSVSCDIYFDSYRKIIYYSDTDKEYWFRRRINIDLNAIVSDVEELDINDNKVLHVTIKDVSFSHVQPILYHYYEFVSSNYEYLIKYRIDNDNDEEIDYKTHPCFKYMDELIYSVKLK